jgi:DNA-binding CsgD family transcriptional regulator
VSQYSARARNQAVKNAAKLTPAERVVFDCLLQGLSTSEIATKLDRSRFTVSNHIRRIFDTFGVSSRAAVIALFVVPPK